MLLKNSCATHFTIDLIICNLFFLKVLVESFNIYLYPRVRQKLTMNFFHQNIQNAQPLSEKLRPQSLSEFVGQKHLVGAGKPLRKMIEDDQITSMVFWGPPGTGKTTLAKLIAKRSESNFVFFSAVEHGVKDLRKIVTFARSEL